jgi:hypothetical protein
MVKKLHTQSSLKRKQIMTSAAYSVDADDLKKMVRDGLVAMTHAERGAFIQALGTELRRADLDMRAYLIPLGISAMTIAELTPSEIGQLVRFLKINKPRSMPVIEKVMARFAAFAEHQRASDNRQAA